MVPRRTARPLHVEGINIKSEQKKQDVFDGLIRRKWGMSINPPKKSNDSKEEYEEYSNQDEMA